MPESDSVELSRRRLVGWLEDVSVYSQRTPGGGLVGRVRLERLVVGFRQKAPSGARGSRQPGAAGAAALSSSCRRLGVCLPGCPCQEPLYELTVVGQEDGFRTHYPGKKPSERQRAPCPGTSVHPLQQASAVGAGHAASNKASQG